MLIALDSETAEITEDDPVPALTCVQWATDKKEGILDHVQGVSFVRGVLQQDWEIVLHNGAYDWTVLIKEKPEIFPLLVQAFEDGRIRDTEIYGRMLDIKEGGYKHYRKLKGRYTLDGMSKRFLSRELDKSDVRLSYGPLRGVPIEQWTEQQRSYALQDPRACYDLCAFLDAKEGEPPDTRRQVVHAFWLRLMSVQGVPTSEEHVRALLERTVKYSAILLRGGSWEAFLDALHPDDRPLLPERGEWAGLLREGLVSWNKKGEIKRSIKEAQRRIERHLGDSAPRTDPSSKFPNGQIQVSAEACELTKDPTMLGYARFTALMDVLNKDADYLRKPWVRPSYGLAESGRGTCFDPNLQNVKVDGGIRESFQAKRPHNTLGLYLDPAEDWSFAIADFSSLELCTVAQVCLKVVGYSKLAEMLLSGVDPLSVFAKELIHYQGTWQELKAAAKTSTACKEYLGRQSAKVTLYGLPGGMGVTPRTDGSDPALIEFAWSNYRVELTREEAPKLKQLWLELFPEFREYFPAIERLGEPLPQLGSGRLRGGAGFTERANSMFQGLGGDAAKYAGWLIAKACYYDQNSVLYGSRPCLFVHDEFVVLVPTYKGSECALELSRLMHVGAKTFLPDVTPHAEPVWSKIWSKSAGSKTIDGKLSCYEG